MLTLIKHSTWLTIILCATSITHTKVIIWDLDTLIKPNDTAFAREVGTFDLIRYGLFTSKPLHKLKQKIYAILSHFGAQKGSKEELVRDGDGEVLPEILSNLFAGKTTAKGALTQALAHIDTLKADYFASEQEKQLVIAILKTMLTPEIFARTLTPAKPAIALLKKCAASYDNCGNPNVIIIACNLDATSFEYLYKDPKFKTVFDAVKRENIVVSGTIRNNKPHKAFFQHILSTYKVKPANCIFIDDQEENIKAAQTIGMTALYEKGKNYKQIEQELRKLCVLQPAAHDKKKIKSQRRKTNL